MGVWYRMMLYAHFWAHVILWTWDRYPGLQALKLFFACWHIILQALSCENSTVIVRQASTQEERTCDWVLQRNCLCNGHGLKPTLKRTWAPKNEDYVVPVHTYAYATCTCTYISYYIGYSRDSISNSHDMLNQKKQEIAQSVPDPFPHEGVGSGDSTPPQNQS